MKVCYNEFTRKYVVLFKYNVKVAKKVCLFWQFSIIGRKEKEWKKVGQVEQSY